MNYIEYPTHYIYNSDTLIIKCDFNSDINSIKFGKWYYNYFVHK